ncbi:hypothetical protein I6F26_32850 [Ensifer sp. IC3342]|nr:hypothetical protein [Ensifer sp. BRP08]MCA1451224.1 hypothetical protein [Ensifer sp. IC3342]
MPVVQKPTSGADVRQGYGLNDLVRRTFFPGLPPMECINGYLFFPWGTGPTVAIPCDRAFTVMMITGGAGRQFVTQPGSKFASAVAEIGAISLREAERAVAEAAGVDQADLEKLTVRDIGRKIVERANEKIGLQNVKISPRDTVGAYFGRLSKALKDVDADQAIEDLSLQTGLPADKLKELPLSDLGDFLDVAEAQPGTTVAYSSGSTVCVSGNGKVGCTRVTGWLEGALWGGLIGGAIGGGVGAAIGAVIGALLSWLF